MGFTALLDEQNRDVGRKLGLATALMFTLPFVTYYVCYYYIFYNKLEPSNWAGAAAVLATNCIIAAYVVVAFAEPDLDADELTKRGLGNNNATGSDNDVQHPRTGIYKQRVD